MRSRNEIPKTLQDWAAGEAAASVTIRKVGVRRPSLQLLAPGTHTLAGISGSGSCCQNYCLCLQYLPNQKRECLPHKFLCSTYLHAHQFLGSARDQWYLNHIWSPGCDSRTFRFPAQLYRKAHQEEVEQKLTKPIDSSHPFPPHPACPGTKCLEMVFPGVPGVKVGFYSLSEYFSICTAACGFEHQPMPFISMLLFYLHLICWVFLNHKFDGQGSSSPLAVWWGSPMSHSLPPYQLCCS